MTEPTNGTSVAIKDGKLPDLNKPSTAIKFADMWSSGKLDKLTTDQQGIFLAALGAHIGLKAELGDLMLYQGKPYITISGYRRIAHNTGLLGGITPRPASDFDRRKYGVKPEEHLWTCEVWKKGSTRPYVGWGYVRERELEQGKRRDGTKFDPITKTHPQEMARKRAVYDALRLAFPPAENIGELHMQFAAEAEMKADLIADAAHGVRSLSGYADEDIEQGDASDLPSEAIDDQKESDELTDEEIQQRDLELETAVMGRRKG